MYAKYINSIDSFEENTPVLASLLEQSRHSEASEKFTIQEKWKEKIAFEINAIAEINPFLDVVEAGQEVSALEAIY